MRSGRGLCIIPKRHVDNYFDLPEHSKTACWIVADRVKMILTDRFGPDGFNIGVNVGCASPNTATSNPTTSNLATPVDKYTGCSDPNLLKQV